ncbi:hypothetical protein SAMN05444171_7502 [Bradyrhizobium lablabi]|uniref:Integrase n=2 Tax=Bradyrhizobium TaxID=374 RepID=A0ABY0QG19_9BRAD|nr:hypothetical protein SAMN05444163_7630 [Bradyrhizobium ottawaense]SEE44230.1 hypothetical protein SAMN05444171_7502 [Bradyrhizobium lablabi]
MANAVESLRQDVDQESADDNLAIDSKLRGLRFFFKVTLGRPDIVERTAFVHEPSKLPVVLSPEEVARLLDAAPSLKYKTALSVAYGAGLRALKWWH